MEIDSGSQASFYTDHQADVLAVEGNEAAIVETMVAEAAIPEATKDTGFSRQELERLLVLKRRRDLERAVRFAHIASRLVG